MDKKYVGFCLGHCSISSAQGSEPDKEKAVNKYILNGKINKYSVYNIIYVSAHMNIRAGDCTRLLDATRRNSGSVVN